MRCAERKVCGSGIFFSMLVLIHVSENKATGGFYL